MNQWPNQKTKQHKNPISHEVVGTPGIYVSSLYM